MQYISSFMTPINGVTFDIYMKNPNSFIVEAKKLGGSYTMPELRQAVYECLKYDYPNISVISFNENRNIVEIYEAEVM